MRSGQQLLTSVVFDGVILDVRLIGYVRLKLADMTGRGGGERALNDRLWPIVSDWRWRVLIQPCLTWTWIRF